MPPSSGTGAAAASAAARAFAVLAAVCTLTLGLTAVARAAELPAHPTPTIQPIPVRVGSGLLLPGAGPNGTDVYLSDAHPDAVYSDPQLDPVDGSQGHARPLDNGGGTHTERVVCQKTGYYRNYNPNTDNFSDLVQYYYRGDSIRTRDAPYRTRGPRGVVVYMNNSWGFMSSSCVTP